MSVWGTKTPVGVPRGVARAAVAGATRKQLLEEAVSRLVTDGRADRVGVWAEPEDFFEEESSGGGDFRGLLWDRDRSELPSEWGRFSTNAPLPSEL